MTSALGSKLLVLALAPVSAFAFELCGDVLAWKASEETELLWASVLSAGPDGTEIFEGENLTFDWNVGFRVGGGHVFDCDLWDVQIFWTSFHSRGGSKIPQMEELIETQFFGGFINKDLSESAEICISLKYNMLDGQLGRNFYFINCFSIRPFMGLKGGWIDQSIHSQWQNITIIPFSQYSATEDITNDFWGIGPVAGAGSKWEIGHCFSFFSDFETALLWGTWANRDVYKSSRGVIINTNMKNSHLGQLMMRAFVGLGWETDIGGWTRFAARLGYEAQIWFSQLRIPTFQQLRLHGDLTLQGGTFTVSLVF